MVSIFECNEWEVIYVLQVERQAHNLSRFELNSTCNGDNVYCAKENQYSGGIS